MAEKEFGIRAVNIYGPGRCPECFTLLTVMDIETSFMELNEDGTPISLETYESCSAICEKCGGRYRMMRLNGKYVPDSDMVRYTHLLKARDEALKRIEENKSKSKENPLALK